MLVSIALRSLALSPGDSPASSRVWSNLPTSSTRLKGLVSQSSMMVLESSVSACGLNGQRNEVYNTPKNTHRALLRRRGSDVLRRSDEECGRVDDALDLIASEDKVVHVEEEGLGYSVLFELKRRSDEGNRREHDELLEPLAGDEIR